MTADSLFSTKFKHCKMKHEEWMQEAVDLSIGGVTRGEGGPFGAIVVKDGVIVGRGNNKVTTGSGDDTITADGGKADFTVEVK